MIRRVAKIAVLLVLGVGALFLGVVTLAAGCARDSRS